MKERGGSLRDSENIPSEGSKMLRNAHQRTGRKGWKEKEKEKEKEKKKKKKKKKEKKKKRKKKEKRERKKKLKNKKKHLVFPEQGPPVNTARKTGGLSGIGERQAAKEAISLLILLF